MSEPRTWTAVFSDYRDLSFGAIQSKPWMGGSNMTSVFEVVPKSAYDTLLAENARLKNWAYEAFQVLNHGTELMPLSKLSKWEGVRAVIETYPSEKPKATK